MKFILKVLSFILVLILIIAEIFIYDGYKMYEEAIQTISLEDKVKSVQNDEDYVKINDVPTYYKNAVVSVEDRRFYEHGPVDIIAIGRAIVSNVKNGKLLEGGSTITQQVAKNLYFITEYDFSRKIAEIFVAFDLEKNYSKDDILELYVNTIYFGDGYYGVTEACNGYFDKETKDMDIYEATMLAGIPNAPSVYAPTANLHLTKSRQAKVISTMVANEYITQDEADKILAEQENR